MNFCCGTLTKHIENELKVVHMVSQVLSLQSFQFFVLTRRYTKSCFRNFSRQYLVIPFFFCFSVFPFVGQFFSNNNSSHSFFYPIFTISLELIEHSCAFCRKLWIFYLLYSFVTDPCEPALEWLGIRRRN